MPARLYTIALSHPAHAARLMLEHKGIDFETTEILAGVHPVVLRARGFTGGTVPALKIGGRRIQGSREIAAALEEIKPDRPLFPADSAAREAVAEAERWGEEVLQPVPRRLIRWGMSHDNGVRRWFLREAAGIPGDPLLGPALLPQALIFARMVGADTETVRADIQRVPELMRHVGSLIDAGTLGGEEVNAADFQIGTSVRVMLGFADLRALVEDTAAAQLALRVFPGFDHELPAFVPAHWLRPA
ncbi:MAG: glutathione S-transferase family protein [Solirubrobacterales bacterium]